MNIGVQHRFKEEEEEFVAAILLHNYITAVHAFMYLMAINNSKHLILEPLHVYEHGTLL